MCVFVRTPQHGAVFLLLCLSSPKKPKEQTKKYIKKSKHPEAQKSEVYPIVQVFQKDQAPNCLTPGRFGAAVLRTAPDLGGDVGAGVSEAPGGWICCLQNRGLVYLGVAWEWYICLQVGEEREGLPTNSLKLSGFSKGYRSSSNQSGVQHEPLQGKICSGFRMSPKLKKPLKAFILQSLLLALTVCN